MKIIASLMKWLIDLFRKKKQPDIKIEAVNSIINITIIHKDWCKKPLLLLFYPFEKESQECIIISAVRASLYDIAPTRRILNLWSFGGDKVKIVAKVIMWLIRKFFIKKQPHIEVVNFINIKITIHKDWCKKPLLPSLYPFAKSCQEYKIVLARRPGG